MSFQDIYSIINSVDIHTKFRNINIGGFVVRMRCIAFLLLSPPRSSAPQIMYNPEAPDFEISPATDMTFSSVA